MDVDQQLAQDATSESKAYGYTLTIWDGGSVLGEIYGSPTIVQTFLYVCGALAAFGVILLVTFDQPFVDVSTGSQIPVPAMLHLGATLGTLFVALLLAWAISVSSLSAVSGFLIVGFQVTVMYNLVLPVETAVARSLVRSRGSETV